MSNVGSAESKLKIFEYKHQAGNGYSVTSPCVVIAEVCFQDGEPYSAIIRSLAFSPEELVDFDLRVGALECAIHEYMDAQKYAMGQDYPAELPLPA